MNDVFNELARGIPPQPVLIGITIRLLVAAIIGGVLGIERTLTGKQAGLRTHMLVCLGSAIFMMVASEAGRSIDTRIVQGIATGIGFVGAGAILKIEDREKVKGLTTAANIWLTAALGTSVGAGQYYLPLAGVVLAWLILGVVDRLEHKLELKHAKPDKPHHDLVDVGE
jgi:putative Mg2+ transporter-C (MgtC) family protein